jgi:putative colanic acid biosynthesis acetyltransferase WcaF
MRFILRKLVKNRRIHNFVLSLMKKYDVFATEVQTFYVREQFGSVGRNFKIGKNVIVEHPENLQIGDNVTIHHNVFIYAYSPIIIEDGALIAQGASLITPKHDFRKTGKELEEAVISKSIRICHDAVINSEAMILGGITVGEGAIVSAKSLVIRNVEPHTYVIGVPAKPFFARKLSDITREEN